MAKAVIIDFDFAAMNGAELLFDAARALFKKIDDIELDAPAEARYLQGNGYLEGISAYFQSIKTKKTPQKAAKELVAAFGDVILKAIPSAISSSFKTFVGELNAKGVKVIIMTRADVEQAKVAFADLLGDNVKLSQDSNLTYGASKWDVWRRVAAMNKVSPSATLAITGSGTGVKSALLAGMGSVAVMNSHVAYQDFGGADEVVSALDKNAAKKVLAALRI